MCICAAQEHGSRRRASGGGMMVEHADAIAGQTVDVGRLDLRAIATDIRETLQEEAVQRVSEWIKAEGMRRGRTRSSARMKRKLGRFCGVSDAAAMVRMSRRQATRWRACARRVKTILSGATTSLERK